MSLVIVNVTFITFDTVIILNSFITSNGLKGKGKNSVMIQASKKSTGF